MNGETRAIIEKIDDLKDFTNTRIDDLREFQIQMNQNLQADITELKESHREQVREFKIYSKNHYEYHRRERRILWRWIFILMGVTIVISASGLAPYLLPYILSFLRLIPL